MAALMAAGLDTDWEEKPGLAPAAKADSNNYKKPRKLREAEGAALVW
jgi:hypothetical protein